MYLESARQIERHRQMSGEQRLAIALEMNRVACEIALEGIRRQFPQESADQHERRLIDRFRESERMKWQNQLPGKIILTDI